jgi:FkbM family methyltransferase
MRPFARILTFFIAIDLIVLWPLLWRPGLPMHGDLAFPLTVSRFEANFLPLWDPYGSVSNLENLDRLLTMLPIFGIAEGLSLSMATVVKLLFFGILLVSQVAMYLWVAYLLKTFHPRNLTLPEHSERGAALVAASLYGFSPWVMPRMSAVFFWIAYAVLPIAMLFLTKALHEQRSVYAVAAAVAWSLGSGSPHFTVLLGLLLVCWTVFLALKGMAAVRWSLGGLAVMGVSYVVLNAYWIWPVMRSWRIEAVSPGYVVSTTDVEMLSRNATPINVLLGRDDWFKWWNSALVDGSGFAHWLWLGAASCLIGLATASVVRSRFHPVAPFFAILVTLSFFLSQGARGLGWPLYKWVMFDAPSAESWGWLLRAPEKFGFFFWFGVAVLIATSAARMAANPALSRLGGVPFVAAVAVAALVFTLPKLTAGTWGPYAPVRIPNDYTRVNAWLGRQPDDSKVLWLAPYNYGWSPLGEAAHTWAPDRIAGNVFPRSSLKPSYGGYHYTNPFAQFRSFIHANLDSPGLWKLLAAPGIGYVVYQADILGAARREASDLSQLKRNLPLVYHYGALYVFRNEAFSPRVSAPRSAFLVYGGLRAFRVLAELSDFNPRQSTLIFRDQQLDTPLDLPAVPLAYDASGNEIVVDRLLTSKGTIMWPFEHTSNGDGSRGWARIRTSNPYSDEWPWHTYLSWLEELDRWDFDYGRGVVATEAPSATLRLTSTVPKSELYDVYVRVLRHRRGGQLRVGANGAEIARLDTAGSEQRLRWELIARAQLPAGANTFTLVSKTGHNVVSAVGLLPSRIRSSGGLKPPNFVFVGEAVRNAGPPVAFVSLPYGGGATLRMHLRLPVKAVEMKLVPGGPSVVAAPVGQTVVANLPGDVGGDYLLLAGKRVRTITELPSLQWEAENGRGPPQGKDESVTAGLADKEGWQFWQSLPVRVKARSQLHLSWELSAIGVDQLHLKVQWIGARQLRAYPVQGQKGTFDRFGGSFIRVPSGADALRFQIVGRRVPGVVGRWILRRLELTRIEGPADFVSVLAGRRGAEVLAGQPARPLGWSAANSAVGPYEISTEGRRIVTLAETFDPLWLGQTITQSGRTSGVEHFAAFGAINAFSVPPRANLLRLRYAPHFWMIQAVEMSVLLVGASIIAIALLRVARRRSRAELKGEESIFRRNLRRLRELSDIRRVFRNWFFIGIVSYLWKFLPLPKREVVFVTRAGTKLRVPLLKNVGAAYSVLAVFAFRPYECEWELEENPVVLDVGANVGAFPLWLAEQRPGVRGLAYEPDPDAFEYLRANLDVNGLAHVDARLEAVSDRTAEGILFRSTPGDGISSLHLTSNPERLREEIITSLVSFDDAIGNVEGEISLLKIDCEGAEYEIVLDSDAASWQRVKRVVIEYHPITGKDPNALANRLTQLGFRLVKEQIRSGGEGTVWLSKEAG